MGAPKIEEKPWIDNAKGRAEDADAVGVGARKRPPRNP